MSPGASLSWDMGVVSSPQVEVQTAIAQLKAIPTLNHGCEFRLNRYSIEIPHTNE